MDSNWVWLPSVYVFMLHWGLKRQMWINLAHRALQFKIGYFQGSCLSPFEPISAKFPAIQMLWCFCQPFINGWCGHQPFYNHGNHWNCIFPVFVVSTTASSEAMPAPDCENCIEICMKTSCVVRLHTRTIHLAKSLLKECTGPDTEQTIPDCRAQILIQRDCNKQRAFLAKHEWH